MRTTAQNNYFVYIGWQWRNFSFLFMPAILAAMM